MIQCDTPRKLRLVNSSIDLGAVQGQDPHEFCQDLQVQYMWPLIRHAVRSAPTPIARFDPVLLTSHEVLEALFDRDIKAELRPDHSFQDPWELRARIEQLKARQPNGEEGDLTTTGPNLFYYGEDIVVLVTWRPLSKLFSTSARWGIESSITDVSAWAMGNRVFSRRQAYRPPN